MFFGYLSIIIQSLIMNAAVGFAYISGTEFSRSRRFLLGQYCASGKRGNVLSQSLLFITEFLKTCVITSFKLNTQWLLYIVVKSMLDIAAFRVFASSSYGLESPGFNTTLAVVSLSLSPLHLIQATIVVGSPYNSDIATGIACGFYHGYLEMTVGFLKGCIDSSRYSAELSKVPKRFILVPENGILIDSLQKVDDRITFVENTSSLREDVSGVKKRAYYQSVYKFTPRDKEFEEFYCIAEQSASVGPIRDIVAGIGGSQNELKQTVRRFYEEVRGMVDCNDAMRDSFEIILFSGREEDVVDAIVNRRKKLLLKH